MSSETLEEIAKNSIYIGNDNELYLNSFCKGFRISNKNAHAEYINYLLFSKTYRIYFSLVGRGFTRINLKQEYVNDAFIILPPLPEQTAIARFLDQKTAQIDLAIAQKERMIALLKEQQQIMVQQAVTKGLNPQVKMKDSGVEWIGEVPEHWEVKRIKHLGKIRYGLGQPPKELENGLPIIRATNVERGKIVKKGMMFIDPKDVPWERNPQLKKDEIIIVRSGAYTGDSAIIPEEFHNSIAGYDMVFTAFKQNSPQFIGYALLSQYVLYNQLYLLRMRAAQPHLNAEELAQTLIILPPLPEQTAIATYLDAQTSKTARAIALQERQIERLKEYKSVLIDAVVRGKVRVG